MSSPLAAANAALPAPHRPDLGKAMYVTSENRPVRVELLYQVLSQ